MDIGGVYMKYKKWIAITITCMFIMVGYKASPYGTAAGIKYNNNNKVYNQVTKNSNNQIINDTYFTKQWSLAITKSVDAWKIIKQKKQIIVAVVDSGVDYNHPDLKNRVLKDEGYNFIDNNKNIMDDLGHGTQVAGIIAAESGNKIGISGIVGSLDVKIIPIKVLDKNGKGPSDVVAKGIRYAVDIGADVINVSIDFEEHDTDIEKALLYASTRGVFVVVASGNSNKNCDSYSPAGDVGAFTVAATTEENSKPYFSSYGTNVSVAAPGIDVLTTTLGGKYSEESGTSMSSPIVAGIAAMLIAQNPNLSINYLSKIIESTATDIQGKGIDKTSGYGLVNALKAVQAVQAIK
jgi:subtilisin family serine protease